MFQSSVLPYEMIELIVIKAVAALYAYHRIRLLPRADVLSLITVSSVCSEWCSIALGTKRSQISFVLKNTGVSLSHDCA